MLYYKHKESQRVHSWNTWVRIAEWEIANLEIDISPWEHVSNKIEEGILIHVEEADYEDLKRANYKILYMAKLMSDNLGIQSQVEIDETNVKIIPYGRYRQSIIEFFQEKIDEYKKKVYKEYEID